MHVEAVAAGSLAPGLVIPVPAQGSSILAESIAHLLAGIASLLADKPSPRNIKISFSK
jgi:hypothetical protein